MKTVIIVGLCIALALAILLSPFASSSPDGLERVGENHGFMEQAHSFLTGLIPDYLFPGVSNEKIATALAGGLGVVIVFGLSYSLMWLIKRKNTQKQN